MGFRPQDSKKPRGKGLSLFSRAIDLFRKTIMSPSLPDFLKTRNYDIAAWMERTAGHIQAMKAYELRNVELWKHIHGVGHEIVIAEFADKTRTIFIAVERGSRDPSMDPGRTAPTGSILPAASTRSLGLSSGVSSITSQGSSDLDPDSSSSTPSISAVDHIWVNSDSGCTSSASIINHIRTPKDGRQVYRCVGSAPGSAENYPLPPIPNLLNFTYAAWAASNTQRTYSPHQNNCYWYANAVTYVLGVKFKSAVSFEKHPEAGHFTFWNLSLPLGELKDHQLGVLTDLYEGYVSPIPLLHSLLFFPV